jgi:hypothetical protein
MTMNSESMAREKLLHTVATLLEVLFEPTAVPIIASLKPAMMRPGGARVIGTSYELDAPAATQIMQQLLALRGVQADALLTALAHADIQARAAAMTAATPPVVSSLYAATASATIVGPDLATHRGATAASVDSLHDALHRVHLAVDQFFTLTQARRIDTLLHSWLRQPNELDTMPVQKFVAQFVRNAPP